MVTQTQNRPQKVTGALWILAILSLIVPEPAYAYLDPGTGSFILQIILAAVAGIGYLVRVFWAGIKGFFTSLFSGNKNKTKENAPHDHEQAHKGTS